MRWHLLGFTLPDVRRQAVQAALALRGGQSPEVTDEATPTEYGGNCPVRASRRGIWHRFRDQDARSVRGDRDDV